MLSLSLLLETLAANPERELFRNHDKLITAAEFVAAVETTARKIATTKKQKWALCYQDTYQFAIMLLAVLHSGNQPILLPNNQSGTLEMFADEYDAVLTDLPTLSAYGTILSEQEQPIQQTLSSEQSIVFFTSGSTGAPKKVVRQLEQLNAEITMLQEVFGKHIDATATYSTVSHQHIYGLIFYVLWPLCAGRVIICPPLAYPDDIIAAVSSGVAMTLVSSPALLKRVLATTIDYDSRCIIFSSGNLLDTETAETIASSFGVNPIEILGSTETSGVAYRQQLLHSAWNPLPAVQIALEQETQCLTVESPYFDHVEPFVMGDKAKINADGSFVLLGRADRIAKVEGKRVALNEIEARLKQHPWIADVYALVLQDNREYIALVIKLSDVGENQSSVHGKDSLNQEFKTILALHLDSVLLPKKFRYVNDMPVNSQGKYVLSAMQDLFSTQDLSKTEIKKPEVISKTVDAENNRVILELLIPKALKYFQGHFPETPVLPGIVQIDWAIDFAQQFFAVEKSHILSMDNIKFTQPILPEYTVVLELALANNLLSFKYGQTDVYSSGKIRVGAIL